MCRSTALASVILAISALTLSGCSQILDWRNAEVSNGKVYERGANTPFSGKVTNVPSSQVFLYRRGYQMAMRAVVHTPAWADKIRTVGLCEVSADDGTLDGEVNCATSDDRLPLYKANFRGGDLHGKFVLYDGTAEKNTVLSASFKDGAIHGTHRLFSPKNQQLLLQAEWNTGKGQGEEARFDESTGAKTSSRIFNQDLLDGAVSAWASDGKTLLYHATFSRGKQVGLERAFYPDGSRKSESMYEEGEQHGPTKQWSESGQLRTHALYQEGRYVKSLSVADEAATAKESSSDALSACAEK